MNRFLDFFRLRRDFASNTWHWLWWTVTDEMIEDGTGLGPVQSAMVRWIGDYDWLRTLKQLPEAEQPDQP